MVGCGTGVVGCGTGMDGCGTPMDGYGTAMDGSGTAMDGYGTAMDGYGTAMDGCGTAMDGCGTAMDGCGTPMDGCGTAMDGFGTAMDGCGTAMDGCGRRDPPHPNLLPQGEKGQETRRPPHLFGRLRAGSALSRKGRPLHNSMRRMPPVIRDDPGQAGPPPLWVPLPSQGQALPSQGRRLRKGLQGEKTSTARSGCAARMHSTTFVLKVE